MSKLLAFLAFLPSLALAQSICTGNLGENIFVEGDFGRGTANIVQTNPGIAPGFQYVTAVPFDDGKYTLTNDMGKWPGIWPTWLLIQDNSTDPLGYMMVVNASYSPGIFYEKTVDGLCDNTLYAFSADVINIVKTGTPNHILPNVSFLIDGEELFTTGPILQNELWKTYGFTFTTKTGQDEVTLTLKNNAPGGNGNDLALDNISFRACGPESSIEIDAEGKVCENTLYPTLSAIIAADTGFVQWQVSADMGISWTDIPGATSRTYQSEQLAAQTYLFRYLYGNTLQHLQNPKCRIVSALKELIVVPVRFQITDTLCAGLSFHLGQQSYDQTGIYEQQLIAHNGCDSIVTLDLTIVPDPDIEATITQTDPTCFGYPDGSIAITEVTQGSPPYLITMTGIGPSPDNVFSVGAGNFTIVIEDRFKCQNLFNISLSDPVPFVVDVQTSDPLIRLGYGTMLSVEGNYPFDTIFWQPTNLVGCAACPATTAFPTNASTFIAQVTSEAGCLAKDSILIQVDRTPRLFIPNVFTPNGDHVNDTWGITADPYTVMSLPRVLIYDRWGSVMRTFTDVHAEDATALWDGRNGLGYAGAGVYVFLAELALADGSTYYRSGSITLVR